MFGLGKKNESDKLQKEIENIESEIESRHKETSVAQAQVSNLTGLINRSGKNWRGKADTVKKRNIFEEQAKVSSTRVRELKNQLAAKREQWLEARNEERDFAARQEVQGADKELESVQQRRAELESRFDTLHDQREQNREVLSGLREQLEQDEQALAKAEQSSIVEGKPLPKASSKDLSSLRNSTEEQTRRVAAFDREIESLESELAEVKAQESEVQKRALEKEFLAIKDDFEAAKQPLYDAEQSFGQSVRELQRRWSALYQRAVAAHCPFHPSRLPYLARVTRFGIETKVTFGDGRDHIFRVDLESK